MNIDKQKIVGRVSASVTRKTADNVENVGLRSANPNYTATQLSKTPETTSPSKDWRTFAGQLKSSPTFAGDPVQIQQGMRNEWD